MVSFILQTGVRYDGTITLGNLISTFCFIIFAAMAWRDIGWKIKNLEEWRKIHQIEATKRDEILDRIEATLTKITTVMEERNRQGGR